MRWWRVVRASLDWQSEACATLCEAGVLAAIAFAVTRQWPEPYAYWFTITLVLTMQPYFALTFTRAVERVGGTVLGGVMRGDPRPPPRRWRSRRRCFR